MLAREKLLRYEIGIDYSSFDGIGRGAGCSTGFCYNLSEQISTSGYQRGEVFELSFIIGGINSGKLSQTWNVTTLDSLSYYLIAQRDLYIGLSSEHDQMLNGNGKAPGEWAAPSQRIDGVNEYVSDGYLYSWLSRDSDGKDSSMSGMRVRK